MHVLITAGPTREPIDAVRFISNRSSGKLGLELAQAGVETGHEVTLLLGPGPQREQHPRGCAVHRFDSSAELKQLLEAHFPNCDALIMAAAVCDHRPQLVAEGKLPLDKGKPLTLVLEPTPDLVRMCAQMRRRGQYVVAFALEEAAHLEDRARAKMLRKGVDAIVANPLGTMEASNITALWLTAGGTREAPGRMNKREFARWLMGRIEGVRG